jgi:glyoxylase-like metal-dependent hydrolase (beta-lactamase superfamily II)
MNFERISEHVYRFEDTCNVYLVVGQNRSILVDFGSGDILDAVRELNVPPIQTVLITHHHRDQVQGLHRAAQEKIHIWVPYYEQDLFYTTAGSHWQTRDTLDNYDVLQERFSLLEPVSYDQLLEDYANYPLGGYDWLVVPTPGHTPGSISLMVEIDGQRLVFTGDLLYAGGKVWSLAATQWSYNGGEGLPATAASLIDLKERQPDLLLPAHGPIIRDPAPSIELTVNRLAELIGLRKQNPRLFKFIESPYTPVTPHLLRSNQNEANSFVLISASGKALIIDYGYDFMTGMAPVTYRAARRPWLYSLKKLKQQYGISKIDVVIPTHYHDDHVAGLNLLRRVEGTQTWVAKNFADILADPYRFNLPCLWYDPIPADCILPLGQPVRWEEYTLTLYPLPGHTLYAVAILFEVDGKRVLAVGDQHQDADGIRWNYVYQNRFQAGDYTRTAELYQALSPDLILSGHWDPLWVKPGYGDELKQRGLALERLHADLLPEEIAAFGAGGFGARIEPYQSFVLSGSAFLLEVIITNQSRAEALAKVHLEIPREWSVEPVSQEIHLNGLDEAMLQFRLSIPPSEVDRRVWVAADLTLSGHRFGQQAEAVVTVLGIRSGLQKLSQD